MRTRAIRRRAYVRYLETEIVNEIRKIDNSCLDISIDIDENESNFIADLDSPYSESYYNSLAL